MNHKTKQKTRKVWKQMMADYDKAERGIQKHVSYCHKQQFDSKAANRSSENSSRRDRAHSGAGANISKNRASTSNDARGQTSWIPTFALRSEKYTRTSSLPRQTSMMRVYVTIPNVTSSHYRSTRRGTSWQNREHVPRTDYSSCSNEISMAIRN